MFPATVVRVEGVEWVVVKYDYYGDDEFSERVEWLRPRVQMPWHPRELEGSFVLMLTQSVRYGDAIEGLEVRWGLACKILKALTALRHLYPQVSCGQPWRVGGSMDEPMHRWYDPKHGMFDVLRIIPTVHRFVHTASDTPGLATVSYTHLTLPTNREV